MAWTTQDKVGLGMSIGSAALGALGSSNQQKSNDKTTAAQQVIAALRNRQAALAEQQALQQRQAEQYAQMNPLGAEQQYIQRQKVLQGILPQLGKNNIMSGDAGIAGAQGDVGAMFRNIAATPGLAQTYSDEAIQRAVLDRRNATTAVDPTIQRMPLSDYGFMNNDSYQKENDDLRAAVLGRQSAARDAIMSDANAEVDQARAAEIQAQQSGGTSWWKKILGPAAGIAANFIPGVGPLVSMGIGALTGGVADGARGAALGAAGGYGGGVLKSGGDFTPWSPNGVSVNSPNLGMAQGNLAESAGMLPGGLMPSEVVDQGWPALMRGAPPQALKGQPWQMSELQQAITGIAPTRGNIGGSGSAAINRGPAAPPMPPTVDRAALGGPNAQMSAGPGMFRRMLGTIGDYGEEIGMPGAANFASGPAGPETPFGRVMQSPIGALMTGGVVAGAPAATGPANGISGQFMGRIPGSGGPSAGALPPGPSPAGLPPAPWPAGLLGPGRTAGRGPMQGISGTQGSEMQAARFLQQLNQLKDYPAAGRDVVQQMQGPLQQIPGRVTQQNPDMIAQIMQELRRRAMGPGGMGAVRP